MTFLSWDNQSDADDSLAAINTVLGCPYGSENGYQMDTWAVVTKHDTEDLWGFYGVEEVLGKTKAEQMAVITAGYTEDETVPDGWFPVES